MILRNWVGVRALVLHFLRKHDIFLGKNLALFSLDEYQPEAGKLFHEHLVFCVKKEINAETERKLLDLICSSVLEVIKPDEIKPLMD